LHHIVTKLKTCFTIVTAVSVWALLIQPGWAVLNPEEVLVVANKNAARSVGLARYYMEKRSIPRENLLQVWTTDKEGCTREEFDREIAGPIRSFVTSSEQGRLIRCLVLMYGVPLKVSGPGLTQEEKARQQELNEALTKIRARIKAKTGDMALLQKEKKKVQEDISELRLELNKGASVDSELALVKAEKVELSMWLQNPYYLPVQHKEKKSLPLRKKDVLMVSRLDGPDSDTIKRIINDTLTAEKRGLSGKAYFDARWPEPKKKELSGYSLYDKSIHLAAKYVDDKSGMPVVLEQTNQLFQAGDCPQAALYCGWYRLANYQDAFDWQQGAVGYHIASSECATLKGESQVWCKRMIEDGVAATLGPVGEPYVQAFPLPEVFFKLLLDGYFSLAECYLLSVPSWSWKMVLVGDPLYRPFKAFGD